MDSIIRRLIKYGAVTIDREYDFWHVGCVVHNPDYSENIYVKATGDKLFFTCKEVLAKAEDEYQRLLLKPHLEQGNLLGD